ncbi:MAG: 5'/3'-nucleotidase SurE [Sporichthyaceae bacterium]
MRVLVTNDDGIDAPGLHALVLALVEAGHDVLVAAPAGDLSGSGTALGDLRDGHRVPIGRVVLPELPDVLAYVVHAPPAMAALCAVAGMFEFKPEVVVAGVNPGWNTGLTVLHSSTVGAAVTAATAKLPAIAVSCGPLPDSRFDVAAAVAAALLADDGAGLQGGVVLNVNVPDLDLSDIKGVRPTTLSPRGVHAISLTRENDAVLVNGWDRTPGPDPDNDSSAVLSGWVSVTEVLPSFPGEQPAPDGGAVTLVAELLKDARG